jgi:hypothetical protein
LSVKHCASGETGVQLAFRGKDDDPHIRCSISLGASVMWRLEIKKLTIAVFFGVGAMLGAGSSHAHPTLVGTTNAANGIDGLVVDGVTYNVSFEYGQYSSVFPSPPTFLGNQNGANDAANSLAAALNLLGVRCIQAYCPGGPGDISDVFIPYYNMSNPSFDPSYNYDTSGYQLAYSLYLYPPAGYTTWSTFTSQNFDICPCYGPQFDNDPSLENSYGWTLFSETPSAVPLPATLPLFASGLGALGLFGWCRERKAQALAA